MTPSILWQRLQRIQRAFGYSIDGLRTAFSSETALRDEVYLCVIGAVILWWIHPPLWQMLWLVSSLWWIIMAELINTAIELVVDRISSDYHVLSKRAKDTASGLVLMACLHAAWIWGMCLWDVVTSYGTQS